MEDKFTIRSKNLESKEDKSVVMTLRLDRKIQKKFDVLSRKSGHSRNELMCMALSYALDHLEFISESGFYPTAFVDSFSK